MKKDIGEILGTLCNFKGTLTLREGIEIIGQYAFSGCPFTGMLTIPENVTAIRKDAFDCFGENYNDYTLTCVFAEGGAPAEMYEAFSTIPLIYPIDAETWTSTWGADCYAWDEAVSSADVSAGLADGGVKLLELEGVTYLLQDGTTKASTAVFSCSIGAGWDGTIDAVTISDKATATDAEWNEPSVKENIYIDTQLLTAAAHVGNVPLLSTEAHNHSGLAWQWRMPDDNRLREDLQGQTASAITYAMTEEPDGAYVRCRLING